MSREEPAQGPPDPAVVDATFPERTIKAGTTVYRSTGPNADGSTGRDPGWFSSDGGGRFDLPLPMGTCYVAGSIATAARERIGKSLRSAPIAGRIARKTWLWTLVATQDLHLADLDDDTAADFHVTRELSSGNDYEMCQEWAKHFEDLEFSGISYHPRFTTSLRSVNAAYAIFSEGGPHSGPFTIQPGPVSLLSVSKSIGFKMSAFKEAADPDEELPAS